VSEGLWEDLNREERERVVVAVGSAMLESGSGPWGLDPVDVAGRAGLSLRRTQSLLADSEAAVEVAVELALERLGPLLSSAYDAEPRWLDRVRAAVMALLRFIGREPELGRILLVCVGGGAETWLRRRRVLAAELAQALETGRSEPQALRGQPLPSAAAMALGGALAVLQEGMLAGQAPLDLFGPVVAAVVLPYLGSAAARRELSRPAPRPRVLVDPERTWEGPGARLPYRTRLTLEAIRAYPGASNREVAERAGIVDQGQASKLLARLHARGLIEKTGARRARGAPNSWHLTDRGERLLDG
jgi:hypothetical protein